jgi:hypothetical protein
MAGLALPELEHRLLDGVRIKPEHRSAAIHAARLFGLGYERKSIAKVIAEELYGREELTQEVKFKSARRKLANWEQKVWFRDLVYHFAVVELDMSTPQILRGVANKAKRGRVDAAKLALGITGRYKERDEDRPGAITINLGMDLPRPSLEPSEKPTTYDVDADAVEIE